MANKNKSIYKINMQADIPNGKKLIKLNNK
jgi:hypothetical protein